MTILLIIVAVIVALVGGMVILTNYRISRIPHMTFDDMLAYTTKNNGKAVITVGMIQNGEASYTVYGENGSVLPQTEHVYEIGSVSKTFTAALLFKAIHEGKMHLDDTIDTYLELPEKKYYPTIRRLITHTSGYKGNYLEKQMIGNTFGGRNAFLGISAEQLLERARKIDLDDKDYPFVYSNFGISVVGAVLSKVYGEDYEALINGFIAEELGLRHTKIADASGDLENYWTWKENDAYMPAGALTSTIGDMLAYAQMQMREVPEYLSATHRALAQINATSGSNAKMSIRLDSIGGAWVIDTENNIIWHNGGTGSYNCYVGFDAEKQVAVVVLSNLSPGKRIPATVMGVKLLRDLQKQ